MENHIELKESGTQICGHWNAIIDINIYTINGRQQWRNAGECNTSYLIKPWKPKWFNWILFNLLVGAYFHLSFKCHSFVILPDSFDTDIIPSFIAGDQWLCSIMQPLFIRWGLWIFALYFNFVFRTIIRRLFCIFLFSSLCCDVYSYSHQFTNTVYNASY